MGAAVLKIRVKLSSRKWQPWSRDAVFIGGLTTTPGVHECWETLKL